jgi:hypothetical protein
MAYYKGETALAGRIMLNFDGFMRRVDYWMRLFSLFTGYVEHRKHLGWKDYLPFYRFTCPIHGEVIDYSHGYAQRLECPKCRTEEKHDIQNGVVEATKQEKNRSRDLP